MSLSAFDLMSKEVTVAQFAAYAKASGHRRPRQPLWNQGDDHPVVNVTWQEAVDFCSWAGGRLPTEAEWEYAARGGRDGRVYPWGDTFDETLVNSGGLGGRDTWNMSAPVGSFPPNELGLYDTAGNVWEWVADWYAAPWAAAAVTDPRGPPSGERRVIRGGSWDSARWRLRTSVRWALSPRGRYNLYIGCRCARDAGRGSAPHASRAHAHADGPNAQEAGRTRQPCRH